MAKKKKPKVLETPGGGEQAPPPEARDKTIRARTPEGIDGASMFEVQSGTWLFNKFRPDEKGRVIVTASQLSRQCKNIRRLLGLGIITPLKGAAHVAGTPS